MKKNMTVGNPFKLILLFAIPLYLGNMLQQLYSTVDTYIVRQTLGIDALSAVGATGSITFLLLGFCMGCTIGLSVITAQFYGAGDEEGVRRSIGTSAIISLIITVIMTIVSISTCRYILEVMQTSPNYIDRSYNYLIVLYAGTFALVLYNFYSSMMRALGDSRTPLYFLALASILNIILDYVLIVYGGFDVEGAAYATVISQFISGICCIFYVRKKFPLLIIKKEYFKIDKQSLKVHLSSALPMGFQFSIIAIGVIAIQYALNNQGDAYVAAYTGASKIEMLMSQVYPALGTAMVTYVAQNYGARKFDRIKQGTRSGMVIASVYTAIIAVVVIFAGDTLISLLLGQTVDPVIRSSAKIYLFYCIASFIFLAMIFVYRNALQGVGFSVLTVIAGIIELVCRVVIIFTLSSSLGFIAVCLATAITWCLTGIFVFIAFAIVSKKLERKYA